MKHLPFFIEGGNMVYEKKRKIVFLAISDAHFNEKGEFINALFLNQENEAVLIDDYQLYCNKVTKWFKEEGYECKIIDRNLDKYKIDDIYHLDVFFNILSGKYIFVNKNAISEENFNELKEIYGQENILTLSREEFTDLTTNFIEIDENNIIFTNNKNFARS